MNLAAMRRRKMTGHDIFKKIVARAEHSGKGYKAAVFVIDGKIGIWPESGNKAEMMFREYPECLMGVYNRDSMPWAIDEDLDFMLNETKSHYIPGGVG